MTIETMDTVQHWGMHIDGQSVDTDEQLVIIDPATEGRVATVARGTVEHADLAVAAARRTFEEGRWAATPPEVRAQVLVRAADLLGERLEELAEPAVDVVEVATDDDRRVVVQVRERVRIEELAQLEATSALIAPERRPVRALPRERASIRETARKQQHGAAETFENGVELFHVSGTRRES